MVAKNKRGWMRILEATIAVMLVSGVLIVVYSKQTSRVASPSDYFYSLQKQILFDISSQSDLRLNVLNIVVDNSSDINFIALDSFINKKIPDIFGYSIRVCELGNTLDFCKMDSVTYIATIEKNVFVEDTIISSELGTKNGAEVYAPKKLRLFIWEKK